MGLQSNTRNKRGLPVGRYFIKFIIHFTVTWHWKPTTWVLPTHIECLYATMIWHVIWIKNIYKQFQTHINTWMEGGTGWGTGWCTGWWADVFVIFMEAHCQQKMVRLMYSKDWVIENVELEENNVTLNPMVSQNFPSKNWLEMGVQLPHFWTNPLLNQPNGPNQLGSILRRAYVHEYHEYCIHKET